MNIDVAQLAIQLLNELDTQNVLNSARAEGVRMLYAKISEEVSKQNGQAAQAGEANQSSSEAGSQEEAK